MVEYEYTRELVNGVWNINNPERKDTEGNQIYLANEVAEAIPNKKFRLNCEGEVATFIFETELTTEEKTTLDTTVQNHKDNSEE